MNVKLLQDLAAQHRSLSAVIDELTRTIHRCTIMVLTETNEIAADIAAARIEAQCEDALIARGNAASERKAIKAKIINEVCR